MQLLTVLLLRNPCESQPFSEWFCYRFEESYIFFCCIILSLWCDVIADQLIQIWILSKQHCLWKKMMRLVPLLRMMLDQLFPFSFVANIIIHPLSALSSVFCSPLVHRWHSHYRLYYYQKCYSSWDSIWSEKWWFSVFLQIRWTSWKTKGGSSVLLYLLDVLSKCKPLMFLLLVSSFQNLKRRFRLKKWKELTCKQNQRYRWCSIF